MTITAFERSPDGGKGLARDTRVRWALEEVGQSYQVRLLSFGAMKEPAHLALQPFGQIPTYEEGDLVLFETGGSCAGDLMMVSVLLRLRPSGILDKYPKLAAYVARGEARPAYERAFAAQRAVNTGNGSMG